MKIRATQHSMMMSEAERQPKMTHSGYWMVRINEADHFVVAWWDAGSECWTHHGEELPVGASVDVMCPAMML